MGSTNHSQVCVPLYLTLGDIALTHILSETEVNTVVVDNSKFFLLFYILSAVGPTSRSRWDPVAGGTPQQVGPLSSLLISGPLLTKLDEEFLRRWLLQEIFLECGVCSPLKIVISC